MATNSYTTRSFYYGCLKNGHHWYNSKLENLFCIGNSDRFGTIPYDFPQFLVHNMDGTFCPKDRKGNRYPEGHCQLTHINGSGGIWTILSMWDNSVDDRPGANSNFVIEGKYGFDQICLLIGREFPDIVARFKFDIIDVTGKLD